MRTKIPSILLSAHLPSFVCFLDKSGVAIPPFFHLFSLFFAKSFALCDNALSRRLRRLFDLLGRLMDSHYRWGGITTQGYTPTKDKYSVAHVTVTATSERDGGNLLQATREERACIITPTGSSHAAVAHCAGRQKRNGSESGQEQQIDATRGATASTRNGHCP